VSLSVKKPCQFPAKKLQEVIFPQRLEGFLPPGGRCCLQLEIVTGYPFIASKNNFARFSHSGTGPFVWFAMGGFSGFRREGWIRLSRRPAHDDGRWR